MSPRCGVLAHDGLAQRRSEGVHRAVALAGDDALAAHVHRTVASVAARPVFALFDDHAKALESERAATALELVVQKETSAAS